MKIQNQEDITTGAAKAAVLTPSFGRETEYDICRIAECC
jgi:hypothetical protein